MNFNEAMYHKQLGANKEAILKMITPYFNDDETLGKKVMDEVHDAVEEHLKTKGVPLKKGVHNLLAYLDQVAIKKVVKINKGSTIALNEFPDSFVLFSNGKDQKTPVHIRADKDLKYNDVIFVLKSVKEAGFYKVSLVTDG